MSARAASTACMTRVSVVCASLRLSAAPCASEEVCPQAKECGVGGTRRQRETLARRRDMYRLPGFSIV